MMTMIMRTVVVGGCRGVAAKKGGSGGCGGMVVMMMVYGGCGWYDNDDDGAAGGKGTKWRVEARDYGDRIDRVTSNLFELGRKSSPENFSGGCGGVAGGGVA
ncbi:hypothetical protein Tco_0248772 [Tanacetum coccineum]